MTRPPAAFLLTIATLLPLPVRAEGTPAMRDTAPPVPPSLPPALVVPDLRPRIFVKDLDHLAELVKEDPAVAAQARALASRERSALLIGGTLVATGVVVALAAVGRESCDAQPFGSQTIQVCHPTGQGQMVLGGALSLGGALTAVALMPRRGDFLDVVNAWNVAHQDRPIELFPLVAQVSPPPFPPPEVSTPGEPPPAAPPARSP
jgi:hypothetical protein